MVKQIYGEVHSRPFIHFLWKTLYLVKFTSSLGNINWILLSYSSNIYWCRYLLFTSLNQIDYPGSPYLFPFRWKWTDSNACWRSWILLAQSSSLPWEIYTWKMVKGSFLSTVSPLRALSMTSRTSESKFSESR